MARYMKYEDVLNVLTEIRCSDCTNDKPLDCHFCQIGVIHRELLKKPVYLNVAPIADTVKKMQELIKERCIEGGIYPAFVASTIDQIAKEMLEGQNEQT